jgi:transcriptional regulator with XRE-family HTH domain
MGAVEWDTLRRKRKGTTSMVSGGTGVALATRLADLKARSGLSYEQLGRKTHLSRSTVHRYCTGRSVPTAFAPVEAIATACGADKAELAKLYRLWERADPDGTGLGGIAVPDELRAETPPAPAPPRRDWRPVNAVLGIALVVVLLAGGSAALPSDDPAPHTTTSPIHAPMWTYAPREIEPDFVGVTVNSNSGLMPTFPVGSARLWNTRTRWQNLEPERGHYDWSTLDRLIEGARAADLLPVLFTFGGTPGWASPNGPKSPYPDGSRSSPPDDLADWDRFVRAVAEQYRGEIGAYELWDLANHTDMFTGSMADLVELTRRASQVIRSVDPAAAVVCPSMGELWDRAALDKLREFAALGGYDHCDAAAVKLSARRDIDPPETMLALADKIDAALYDSHTSIRLWSTGSSFDINNQPRLDPDRGADYAVRFYLSGLYATFRRMYFYNWGNSKIPIVLQPTGGPVTKAGRYVGQLDQWLTDSRIHSCGEGRQAGLPGGLWQCRFDLRGKTFLIWWTIDQRLRIPVASGTTSVEHLDGSSTPVKPGADVTVTGTPILLRVG